LPFGFEVTKLHFKKQETKGFGFGEVGIHYTGLTIGGG
jgi:hypothetical protein